jgi:lambda repressor-like predicted transcriptional regulator
MSLNVIQRFSIASTFGPDQRSTFAEIAARAGLRESTVKHVLRHAMTLRVFCEPSKGVVAHTARSALLRSPAEADFLGVCVEEIDPSVLKVG